MVQNICPNCGRKFDADATCCPGCGHTNEHMQVDSKPVVNTPNNKISGWNTFANILIVFGFIGAAYLIVSGEADIVVLDKALVSNLLICGIVKLLAKIELNTRN